MDQYVKESVATIGRWEQEIGKLEDRLPEVERIAAQHGITVTELEEVARSVALWGGRSGMVENANTRYGAVFMAIAAALGVADAQDEGGH